MDIHTMKLPDALTSLFQRKAKQTNVFLSLYLDTYRVAASFWHLDKNGSAVLLASEHADVHSDAWEDRSSAVDTIIGLLEAKTGHTEVTKAILGLPPAYLTATGEIRKDIGIEIRQFTKALELQAIGFVPLQQEVIFKMKKDEGVPPSVILLGINDQSLSLAIYKIGEMVGIREIEKLDDVVTNVEQGLKSFTDLEVLPTRMMLFGSKTNELEEVKSKLLKHPWTSRVNFLHFPKIEIIEISLIIESISMAGASELAASMEEPSEEDPIAELPSEEKELIEEVVSEEILESSQPVEEMIKQSESDSNVHTAVADSTPDAIEEVSGEQLKEEIEQAQEVISEDFSVDQESSQDANVVMVDAESLGFKKNTDVLEVVKSEDIEEDDNETSDELLSEQGRPKFQLPKFDLSRSFFGVISLFSGSSSGSKRGIAIIGILALIILFGALYWLVPRSQLTIFSVPKEIDSQQSIVIDPASTTTDAQNFIVPGKKREKSVSGENTVPVNGKKSIGDPAQGVVTIYNKALSSKTFKKGTVISSGSLQFTLDSDVQIASASESVGSITFGKGEASVTARTIGTASNLQPGTEFTFKEIPSSSATARNDKAFVGGSSREVTVVSRADYDSFVKIQSEELVGKAKDELSKSVTNSEKLIDSTIKTTVTEKVFSKELDQEAKELQGKLTISVSGIAYSESDIHALLSSLSIDKVPSGYEIDEEKTKITVTNVVVKKDGKITADARMNAIAMPKYDTAVIQSAIAGKSTLKAQEYLKTLPGVGAVSFGFTNSMTQSTLPFNKNNISVLYTVFQ